MITLNELCAHLLPPEEHLHFKTLILDEQRIMLVATMTAPKAACPDCHHLAVRIHRRYPRPLADLPGAVAPIQLRLTVRRFFCTTCTCSRQTFSERLPTVAPWYARTTTRLATRQAETGLALGGAAGARHLARQGLPISRNTVLRRVRRLPTPAYPPPEVIGLDDWAWHKGHRYGTIVVDLERGCPLDVLEDRLADTVADWLKGHPDVKIVARDRAEAYASGIRQGAPEATQVADRFHLFQNLAATLEAVFSAHHQDLTALHEATHPKPIPLDAEAVAVLVAPPGASPKARQQSAQSRARRLAIYEQVWALHYQGWSQRAIAAHMGCARLTVQRFLRAPTFPERQPLHRCRSTLLPRFTAYWLERWNTGCRNGAQLFREIKAHGFRGQYSIVSAYVGRRRAAQQRVAPGEVSAAHSATIMAAETPLTPREATWLVMRREAKRNDDEKHQLAMLQASGGEMAEAITLTQDFADLVRQRKPDQLEAWLERAAVSCLQAFQSFANGLRADDAAVKAGVPLPWSTGPVEGQINRLKMLKRQMFGRANIDLLKQRVLYRM
jgi:transposase